MKEEGSVRATMSHVSMKPVDSNCNVMSKGESVFSNEERNDALRKALCWRGNMVAVSGENWRGN